MKSFRVPRRRLTPALWLGGLLAMAAPAVAATELPPLLASRCLECHGEKKQEGGLRLDFRSDALRGGEHGPALVAGKPADSLLLQVVEGTHREIEAMPKKGPRLTPAEIGGLRDWIAAGAPYPEAARTRSSDVRSSHWAFQPVRRPPPPAAAGLPPLDAWVRQALAVHGLEPSPEADRRTLIRRLSLDLTGLPPSPEEVDAFVADPAPDAYDRLVTRLLKSPHYGERWARWWLDSARYADSNGFEKDRTRSIWPWRDWVIRALNEDLPFDRFTIEQLAGDLLPGATLDQRVATGFLRNSMVNMEGGIEPEKFRVEAMIDRVDCVSRTWLGLTVACAQCHSHKYDPISQREYYQFYAFLNQDDESRLEVPSRAQQEKREAILARVRALEDGWLADAGVRSGFERWLAAEARRSDPWIPLDAREWHSTPMKFEKQEDLSLLGGGDVYNTGVLRVWVDTALTGLTGVRLEAMNDGNLPFRGPGIDGKGDFMVVEFTVESTPLAELARPGAGSTNFVATTNRVAFSRVQADWESPDFPAARMIDGSVTNGGWASAPGVGRRNQERRAVFIATEPFGSAGGSRLLLTVNSKPPGGLQVQSERVSNFLPGRVRLSVTTNREPVEADPLSAVQRGWLLAGEEHALSDPQRRELFRVHLFREPSLAARAKEWEEAWREWPGADHTTLALSARPVPRSTKVFRRGDWTRPTTPVEPGVPAVLHPAAPDTPPNRLGLARWLVDARNPLTPRVIVNRVWQTYFGAGLVTTPEDFGTRAEPPSHPELLDWLAGEFVARGWSLKELHRLIVTSATYRQSSRVTAAHLEKDPYNRWLARSPRLRLEAEMIPDLALKAAGLLSPKIGGPSVFPPLPDGVMQLSYGPIAWNVSEGDDRYRRSLYTFWKRSVPYPALTAFDAPAAEQSCVRRARSNTPLQALVTLNEPTLNNAARWLAWHSLWQGGTGDASRLAHLMRQVLGRGPGGREGEILLGLRDAAAAEYEADPKAAGVFALSDPRNPPPLPPGVTTPQLAAWTAVARAVLNLDEAITRE